jgi:NADPH:quinone reductase-like Zn-dependent oxidoreductase
MPKPPLPHIPGCDAAGIVEEIGSEVTSIAVGDEVVVNPAVSPVADIVKYGNNSPMGPGFMG